MSFTTDRKARALAALALVVALGAYALGSASADETTEPDAAALAMRVDQLEARVTQLEADAINQPDVDLFDLDRRVGDLEEADVSGCLAYSDFHYYRERVGAGTARGARRWRLPVMVWNMASPNCRPEPTKVWKPKHRATQPLAATR